MLKRQAFLFFFCTLFFFSFVMGEELETLDLGSYTQSKPLNLLLDCSYNGTYCPSNFACNVTKLQYENGSLMLGNSLMGQAFFPSYNLTIPNTNQTGWHYGRQTCCRGTECGDRSFKYIITPTGKLQSNSQSIISAVILLVIIGLIFISLTYGFKLLPDRHLHLIGVVLLFLGLMLTIYGVYLTTTYTRNLALEDSSTMQTILFWTIRGLGLFGMVSLIVYGARKLYQYTAERKQARNSDGYQEYEENERY